MKRSNKNNKRRGQALVEYIIIVASVAFIAMVSVSIFGHKVADQFAIGAGLLLGAHAEDNAPILTGEFAGFTDTGSGANIGNGEVSWGDVTGNTEPGEMDNNVITNNGNGAESFVAE